MMQAHVAKKAYYSGQRVAEDLLFDETYLDELQCDAEYELAERVMSYRMSLDED